jgi:hypothetical protein
MAELYTTIKDPEEVLKNLRDMDVTPEESEHRRLIVDTKKEKSYDHEDLRNVLQQYDKLHGINKELESAKETLKNQEKEIDTDGMYHSLSKIIEILDSDRLILNQQVKKIKHDMEFVYKTIGSLNLEIEYMKNTYLEENAYVLNKISSNKSENSIPTESPNKYEAHITLKTDIEDLYNKCKKIPELKKQILQMRSMILKIVNNHVDTIKKELCDLKESKLNINKIIYEEVKKYIANAPSLEQRFDSFDKKYKAKMAHYVRKSTIQKKSFNHIDMGELITIVQDQIKTVDSRHTSGMDLRHLNNIGILFSSTHIFTPSNNIFVQLVLFISENSFSNSSVILRKLSSSSNSIKKCDISSIVKNDKGVGRNIININVIIVRTTIVDII